ncbi:hypothetical protein [Lachnoanaerobaculum saburreum]|jgi:hypothetical protein|uniref:Uncharacterized protein n=1 Tax=Lachnoanaerobaculum saburreum TaxID=467210 RepID=A0A133ZGB9_9FIRM|nr:hypothetical protein [Lachnoanaerobaculum saburreum]KXB54503.1 hypothetical protein HMPREF1866_02355 [Lachnoanaerobaculum saburreum]DAO21444.1 MAG TPA: hypothetical protein [Caudoviricetes sp.]
MINIKDLKLGQCVYVVKVGYVRSTRKQELDEIIKTKVVKVGRRYISVDIKGFIETFDSQKDFKIYNQYDKPRFELYLTEKDYFDELKKAKLSRKIKSFFDDYSYKYYLIISLEDLENINNIIDKY